MRTRGRVALMLLVASAAVGCGSVSPSKTDAGATGGASGAASGAAGSTGGSIAGTTGGAGAGGTSVDASVDGTGATDAGGPPGIFVRKTPIDGDPTVSTTPTLIWSPSAGADSYTVEIATTPTFGAADVVQKTGVTDTTFTVPTALQAGVVYYWLVTAVNAHGTRAAEDNPFGMSSPVSAGPSPHGVAVTPDGKRAIVTNDMPSGTATLLDLTAFTTTTVPLPGQPGMVAVTPDGKEALVVEGSVNGVAIVDLTSDTVTGMISPPCVATTLYGLAIKPDGSAAVVPDVAGNCITNVLDVIALPGTTIAPTLSLGASGSFFGVAVTVDGASALLTRGILGTNVSRVDLASGALTPIANTSASFGVAATPDGKQALVSSGDRDNVKVLSLATNAGTGTVAFATNTDVANLAISSDGRFAAAVGDFNVALISLGAGGVAYTYMLAGRSVAFTPDGQRALVTGAGAAGKVYVIAVPAVKILTP